MTEVERLERQVRLLAASIHNRRYRDVERALGVRGAAALYVGKGEIALSVDEKKEIDALVLAVRREGS